MPRDPADGLSPPPRVSPDERRAARCGAVFAVEAEPDPSEPAEPELPEVSAKAIGIATSTEPTPSARASAPTRPTDPPDTALPVSGTTRRSGSIGRTRSDGCTLVLASIQKRERHARDDCPCTAVNHPAWSVDSKRGEWPKSV